MPVEDNNILTDSVIAKEALRLLKNNLVVANQVYRTYEQTFGKVGDTINLKLPYRIKAQSGRVLVRSPMVDQTIPFTINQQRHIGLEYTLKDKTLKIEQFSERYLKSGMVQLANEVDRSALMTLKKAYHSTGTPGTRPGAFIDFANANAKMTTYGVPDDGMKRAILPPFVCAQLSDEVTRLQQQGMVKDVYVKGYKGPVATLETFESQNLPVHTVGAHGGTPLVNGTVTNGTLAVGSTIPTDGWTASTQVLNEGDIIYFDDTFGVNPQNYDTTGMLKEFVVLSDVTSDGAGAASINVWPPMNDGTATVTNSEGETVSLEAYQNVTQLPPDNTGITVLGVAGGQYEQSYLFHKEAIALAVIDLELPKRAVMAERVSDPQTGLSLLMTGWFDGEEHSETTRIDVVYGVDMINGELCMRQWGANLAA